MSWIAGFDISTNAVDCVLVPEEPGGDWLSGPRLHHWHHFPLTGTDAWERTRGVDDNVPGRGWWEDTGLYAAGIEVPFGFSSAKVSMVIGALLNRLPRDILIERWPHNSWRASLHMKGRGSSAEMKAAAVAFSIAELHAVAPTTLEGPYLAHINEWTTDAHEAHCIALATRQAISVGKAA